MNGTSSRAVLSRERTARASLQVESRRRDVHRHLRGRKYHQRQGLFRGRRYDYRDLTSGDVLTGIVSTDDTDSNAEGPVSEIVDPQAGCSL